MPSQVVDDAWHEFILFTRQYQQFCERGLGRFLHHTPAEAMRSPTDAQDGIKRAWRLACQRDGIDPKAPQSLPLLFALDACSALPVASSISSIVLQRCRPVPEPASAPAISAAAAAVVAAAMATVRLVTGAVAAAAAATEVARVSGQTGPSGLCGRAHWYWSAGRFFQRAHVATSPGETTRS
jgi:hypothetical protein